MVDAPSYPDSSAAIDESHTPVKAPITKAPPPVVMPGALDALKGKPIPNDGWKSRKLIIGTAFATLIFVAACVLLVWSGRYSESQWFDQSYWLYATGASVCLIGLTLGLLTIGTLLELIKLVVPIMRGGGGK